jgi:hypothetical protein
MTTEELFEVEQQNSPGDGNEDWNRYDGVAKRTLNRKFIDRYRLGRGDSLRWPRGTLYPLRLVLTSPTSGGRSVGIVRLRTQATEFFCFFLSRVTQMTPCMT